MNLRDRIEQTLLAVDAILGKPGDAPEASAAASPTVPLRAGSRGRRRPPPGFGRSGQLELGLAQGNAPADLRASEPPGSDDRGSGGAGNEILRRAPGSLRAERALRSLGGDVWESFEYALRTEVPLEREAAAFAALALLCGGEAASDRSRQEVRAVRSAAFKTRREVHRLLGLLRFAPDEAGVFTACCEPDNDILDLLAPAFLRRFGAEPFRILDLRRGRAVVSDGRISLPKSACESVPDEEPDPVDLWRVYYRAAENPARTNPRLRLQFMPRRYWKHLPEIDA